MIIKEFTKDITVKEFSEWWETHDIYTEAWSNLIRHMETKFEALEEKIDNLEEELAEIKLQKTMTDHLNYLNSKEHPKFKVGWVYEDKYGDPFYLVYKDQDRKTKDYYFVALNVNRSIEVDVVFFKVDGHPAGLPEKCMSPKSNLIHSTGKKWEIEE